MRIIATCFAFLGLTGTLAAQGISGSELTAGAAVSSERGAVGSIGLNGMDLFGTGLDLGVEYRAGSEGEDARLRLRYTYGLGDTPIGADTRLIFSASHSKTDWEDDSYSGQRSRLSFGVASRPVEWLDVRTALFAQFDEINDIRVDTSPLVLAEKGRSDTGGIEVGLTFGKIDRRELPRAGQTLGLTFAWAGMGERRFASGEISGTIAREIVTDWTLALKGGMGIIRALDGRDLSIHDRAFLGGIAPRGFAIGGVGPRDYVAGQIDTPLGGSRYANVSLELRRAFTDAVTIGIFADAGTVWDLDGPRLGASGLIDDSRDWRSSAGLAVYWTTRLGTLSFSAAHPLRKRDTDTLNEFSLNLISSF